MGVPPNAVPQLAQNLVFGGLARPQLGQFMVYAHFIAAATKAHCQ